MSGRLKRACGFTLIEILIAITIFGFILAVIYPSFRSIADSAAYLKKDTDQYDMAMSCLTRMGEDFASLHVIHKPEYKTPDFDADPDRYRFTALNEYTDNVDVPVVRFSSMAHLGTAGSTNTGVARIVYYCQKEDDGTLSLKRADTLRPEKTFEPKPYDPLLARQLTGIHYTFYDASGEVFETWDSEAEAYGYATPSAVKIVLWFSEKEKKITIGTTIKLPVFREKTEI